MPIDGYQKSCDSMVHGFYEPLIFLWDRRFSLFD